MNKSHIASLAMLSFFLVLAAGSSDDRTPEEKAQAECENKTSAFIMTQEFVTKRLKSPSTAKFPHASDDGVNLAYQGECKHKVLAYVDSQNGFGAMIRTKYYAEIQNKKGTDTWILLDLQME